MTDVAQQISVVRRQVERRAGETGETHAVTLSRLYDARVEEVWDACTNPERIPRWFLPVSGELRLGGRYQLEGNAGGTIERCQPPRSFAATWEYAGNVSSIEVRLTEQADGQTLLELEHVVPADEHWAQFGPGAVGVGWDLTLTGLERHLTSGHVVDPADVAAWSAGEEGRQFMSLSSRGWCDAGIAAGADPADARAAADRTTAFYTGL
jgi:uncharacterized protein YndB with AHSA1/START domain